jgi:hypothetical protein
LTRYRRFEDQRLLARLAILEAVMIPPWRLAAVSMAAVGLIAAAPAPAPAPTIYPAKGQSQAKQNKDRQECDQWAVQQTGYDPAYHAPPEQTKNKRVKGGLIGAGAGAVVGGIGGNAGKGAAIGAVTGVVAGGAKQRRENKAKNTTYAANVDGYNRALSACMSGRGYSVK